MLRAAKTIVLQGCDEENILEHTSVMAAKGVSLTSATYYAAGNSNMTNCGNKTGMPGIGMHYLLRDETLRKNPDSVSPTSQETDSSHSFRKHLCEKSLDL